MPNNRIYIVFGNISNKNGESLSGILVWAFDEDPNSPMDLLGTCETDNKGFYKITYTEDKFKKPKESGGPDIVIKLYSPNGELIHETPRKPNASVKEKINIIDLDYEIEVVDEKKIYTISGKLINHRGEAIPGVLVEGFDKRLSEEYNSLKHLGSAISGTDGSYSFAFSSEKIADRVKSEPDILIKVTDNHGTEIHSFTKYNLKEKEELNLFVQKDKFLGGTEFDNLTQQIKKYLGNKERIENIKEDDKQKGITYLAGKTKWDRRLVAMNVLSHRFASKNIPADFYYALFRSGCSSDKSLIYRLNANKAIKVYRNLIEHDIIKEINVSDDILKKAFIDRSVTEILESRNVNAVSTTDQMLSIVLKNSSRKKDKFIRMYYHGDGEIEETWEEIKKSFTQNNEGNKLELVGKMGYLTFDNAPLIRKVFENTQNKITTPKDLITHGYYEKKIWLELLNNPALRIKIPDIFEGEDEAERKQKYIDWMVNQIKLAYPTALVSKMVELDKLKITNKANIKEQILNKALNHEKIKYDISRQPVNKFIKELIDYGENLDKEAIKGLRQLFRVYQLSPSIDHMEVLLQENLDSSFKIAKYKPEVFVKNYKDKLKGEKTAKLIYDKAVLNAGVVTNLLSSYMTQATNPLPTAIAEKVRNSPEASVKKYPTIEELFGPMDYCECGHCESVLSPAAYLVDLLQFLDKSDLVGDDENPLKRLLKKRPDIEHIELSCKNTTTELPYIDLVNEIMEYFVYHKDESSDDENARLEMQIEGFTGFNTYEEETSEVLISEPKNIGNLVYDEKLNNEKFPISFPFIRNLELNRLYFNKMDIQLSEAMELFRKTDKLEDDWLNIFIESLNMSKLEYDILTKSDDIIIQELYGVKDADSINKKIPDAKTFCKVVNISYKELVDILETRFINPNNDLIPKLKKLQAAFNSNKKADEQIKDDYGDKSLYQVIFEFYENNGNVDLAKILNILNGDYSDFDNDLISWIKDNYLDIMSLISLAPKSPESDICDFSTLVIRYTEPLASTADEADGFLSNITDLDYWKLIRFIRLWKKMGWTIEETDKVIENLSDDNICDFYDDDTWTVSDMDKAFRDLVIKIALLKRIANRLELKVSEHFSWLSSLFIPADKLKIEQKDERRRTLYKHLKINESEANAIESLTNIDSFAGVTYIVNDDFTEPEVLKFINKTKTIKDSKFSIQELNYLLMHEDATGKSGPNDEQILIIAKQIIDTLKKINGEYKADETLSEEKAKELLSMIFGSDLADKIYAIVSDTRIYEVDYTQANEDLPQNVTDNNDQINYDHFRKILSYRGSMKLKDREFLEDFGNIDFKDAIDKLYKISKEENEDYKAFIEEQEGFFKSWEDSNSFTEYIEDNLKPLIRELKIKTINQLLSSSFDINKNTLNSLFECKLSDGLNFILHSNEKTNEPIIHDYLTLEKNGINAEYSKYDEPIINNFNGVVEFEELVKNFKQLTEIDDSDIKNIDYNIDNKLPVTPDGGGSTIASIWQFYINVPESSNYNFYFTMNAGCELLLFVNNKKINLTKSTINSFEKWQNADSIFLDGGNLCLVQMAAIKLKDTAKIEWQNEKGIISLIPDQILIPYNCINNFQHTFIRTLKSIKLIESLSLSDKEVRYFSDKSEFKFGDLGFLNKIPTSKVYSINDIHKLFDYLIKILNYNTIKVNLNDNGCELLEFLSSPKENAENSNLKLLLFTQWGETKFINVVKQILGTDLPDILKNENIHEQIKKEFLRISRGMQLINSLDIDESLIIECLNDLTIDPNPLKDKLKLKYDRTSWLEIAKEINNKIRNKQRKALVEYILCAFQYTTEKHIDTPEKLFEYFLIDVEMGTCRKTSRIKQAISATQLFIQRCFNNLEAGIDKTLLSAEQWEWMKRYRVWEANRKVFLHPENWLEPALRTDKTPIFREFEGELLQSDITDEKATVAYLNYLEKLDKIALLNICGMCKEGANKIHVVARTNGIKKEYYHRILHSNKWSPWEKINLDIEDGPVIPVYWKGRLFLYWTSVIIKGERPSFSEDDGNLSQIDKSEINKNTGQKLEVNLCWSEFFNDKWQAKMTTDFNEPIEILLPEQEYNHKLLKLITKEDALYRLIVYVSYNKKVENYFSFYNKYSTPEKNGSTLFNQKFPAIDIFSSMKFGRTIEFTNDFDNTLTIRFNLFNWTARPDKRYCTILNNKFIGAADFNHTIIIAEDPFFCEDHKNVFFVTMEPPVGGLDYLPEYNYDPGTVENTSPGYGGSFIPKNVDAEAEGSDKYERYPDSP